MPLSTVDHSIVTKQTFLFFLLCLFFFSSEVSATLIVNAKNGKWRITGNDRRDIGLLLETLRKSSTGRKLLKKASKRARQYGKSLTSLLSIGAGSLTDTTLIRRFPAQAPDQIEYEHRAKVVINGELNLVDAVLDLAHELTHFTYRLAFNPYEGKYNPTGFVKKTIEGRGGEVDAYLVECKVFRELFPNRYGRDNHCSKIMVGPERKLSRRKAVLNFYKIGPHFRDFKKQIENTPEPESLPLVDKKTPQFISSAYGVPYPVAALREYEFVLSKVCANDERRLDIMQKTLPRSPAGERKPGKKLALFDRLKNSYLDRCMSFN